MWVVLAIRDQKLIKSLFRNTLITSLSFTIAFILGESQQAYSTQEQWVAIILVGIIVGSTFCTGIAIFGLFNNGPNPVLDTIVPIVVLPVIIGSYLTAFGKRSTLIMVGCTRDQYSTSATHIVRGLSYTTLSVLLFTCLLSLIAILPFRYSNCKTQKRICFCTVTVCWLSTFVFTVVTAEYLMATAFYEESNGSSIALRASSWGLGQVMSVIMMASFIWQIANFYFEHHGISLSVQWMSCGFHFRRTPPDARQDTEMGILPPGRDNSTDQSGDPRRNVDLTNANSETDQVASMTQE